MISNQTSHDQTGVTFEKVHSEELKRLAWRRERVRGETEPAGPLPDGEALAVTNAHRMKPFGLAFSGGGIRSATFNLGILQGLAEHDLLRRVDYLSTVSGGGYIGSWLHGFVKHHCDGDMTEATCRLSPTRKPIEGPPMSDPIAFLRKYSNYLAPSPGLFSADTWVIAAIWLRNVLLNQLILLPALAVPMLAAMILVLVQRRLPSGGWQFDAYHYITAGIVAVALLGAAWGAAINLRPIVRRTLGADPEPSDANEPLRRPLERAVVPLLFVVAVVLGCTDLGSGDVAAAAAADWRLLALLVVVFSGPYFLLAFGGGFVSHYASLHKELPGWLPGSLNRWLKPQVIATIFILGISLAAAALTFWLLHELLEEARDWHPWNRVALVPVLVHLVVEAGIVLFVGLMGADYPDGAREWVARVGTRLNLICAAWLALFTVAVWGPYGIAWGIGHYGGTTLTALAAWVATTGLGVSAGRSARSGARENEGSAPPSGRIMAAIIGLAPTVFMGGYLLLISFGVHQAATSWLTVPASPPAEQTAASSRLTIGVTVPEAATPIEVSVNRSGERSAVEQWFAEVGAYANSYFDVFRRFEADRRPDAPALSAAADRANRIAGRQAEIDARIWGLLALAAICVGVVVAASRRININEFSLHHFYKNRLVRCYLGASHGRSRRPNALTGFDPADDFALSKLQANFPFVPSTEPKPLEDGQCEYSGPYPIINTTLNVNVGVELAQQERKSTSFVFTPEYCGFETWPSTATPRPSTDTFDQGGYRKTWGVDHGYSAPEGPTIGHAMAISGAAANPNSGYATTNAMAFLLTVFDARLGWWLGNPRWQEASRKQGPSFALGSLLSELFAQTTARSKFVNLSDGGHFDNLGLYELVRRRCRYIIVGDGEQDGELTFGSLGGAIRKCRADFGVEIAIDPTPIRLQADGRSKVHCVVGTITYPEIDPEQPEPMTRLNGTGDLSKVKTATGRSRGWILYLKSSLTGNEPADVIEYQARNPEFPHQSTGDQFFSESQFESYRRLGLHVVREAFEGVLGKAGDVTEWRQPAPSVEAPPKSSVAADVAKVKKCKETSPATAANNKTLTQIFQGLTTKWYPAIPLTHEAASRLNKEYGEMVKRLGDDKLTPLLNEMLADRGGTPAWPADRPDSEPFVFMVEQIGLMENVFTEFGFEHAANRANPRNRGWMKVFRQWAKSPQFYEALWPRVRESYNPVFQEFIDQLHNDEIDDVPTQN